MAEGERRGLERRFIQIYFWVFWLMCLNGTYLNLFLKRESHFTGTQIGALSGVLSATGVFLTPLIGLWFDASRDRPKFLAMLALVAGAAFLFYSLPVDWYVLLPVAVLFASGWLPIIPLLDTMASSDHVKGASSRGYGGYRRWGTVGFAVAGGAGGLLTGAVGLRAAFPLYAGCAILVAWLARGIPRHAAGHRAAPGTPARLPRPADVLDLLRLPNFRRFLGVVLISSMGAGACYSFRSIYLSSIGLSDLAIGLLWLWIIPGEVICFTRAARWQERWGTGPLVTVGLIAAGLRWILLGYVNVPLLYAVELLHGVGFAVSHPAMVGFVQREAPARLRGTAQILFFSTTVGLGSAVGAATAGRIYDVSGMRPVLWFGGGLIMLGGLLQTLVVRHHGPANRTR